MRELRNLAVHHKNILENKFPQYSYHLKAGLTELVYFRMRVEVPGKNLWLLSMSFMLTSIKVLISRLDCRSDGLFSQAIAPPIQPQYDNFKSEVIHYADPKFTDRTLSDMLKEQERNLQKLKI